MASIPSDRAARPLLGISACTRALGGETAQATMERYIDAAARYADCVPVLVPSRPDLFAAAEVAARIDGLLLTGSLSNVAPARYGDGAPGDGPFDAGRDAMSIALIEAMRAAGKPVFGICRGFQEINVAFGGTLARDLGDGGRALVHHAAADADLAATFACAHDVALTEGGVLAAALGVASLRVNSVHFQGVGRLGDGLVAEARAADGVVEAVAGPAGGPALLAVQWHPEWTADEDGAARRFFALLGRALRGLPLVDPPEGERAPRRFVRTTGIRTMTTDQFKRWINEKQISEVECLVPDMNGVLRGKVWPAQKFLQAAANGTLRMPGSVFDVTVTGDYADDGVERAFADPDVTLHPDASSLCVAPGFKTPTAFVFADAHTKTGEAYPIAPRHVLRRVLDLYAGMGWSIAVAPELEFYLTAQNTDPDLPLVPPTGRSGRAETSPQPYGLEAVTEYEDIIEEIYERAESASLQLDTMIHEAGTAQLEINFNHGEPIQLSDQVLLFKRIVRQVALKHNVYATFMAKPMENQPGSAMHLHISAHDAEGENLFGSPDGPTEAFRHFVGGLQEFLPHVTPLFAPNVNSFRRMQPDHSAPINLQWGYDNRSCGLRVPISSARSMRVENRLPGADSNPYLAIASSLVAGYLGLQQRIEPMPMLDTNAYLHERTLPRSLDVALDRMASCDAVRDILGAEFVESFLRIKLKELGAFQGVISSWERDHLLLKV